jgi:CRISPR-associated protein Cst2
MSIHIHATILTAHAVAANNRGLTEGNITTLQKLVWGTGEVHTTVSAESIRFALRRHFQEEDEKILNRTYDETERANKWKDADFSDPGKYLDDDLLGFMSAKAAANESQDALATDNEDSKKGKPKRGNSNTLVRRSPLEITRAVSLVPWLGDVIYNFASPGATPSAQKKGTNPVPYGTETHATRYQYSLSLTPEHLKQKERAGKALRVICSLGSVAGNNARFLFDFSPESIVIRVTHDPAPRILYCFGSRENNTVHLDQLLKKIKQDDIKPEELFVGGMILNTLCDDALTTLGHTGDKLGVKAACENALAKAKLT